MAIDLSQFIPTFLAESREGLDTMESCLLELTPGDNETINTIFRAAHSIKGGAGTFGFQQVGEFTHGLETLLDQMRNGQLDVTEPRIALLLEAVDCVRSLLDEATEGEAADAQIVALVQQRLHEEVGDSGSSERAAETTAVTSGEAGTGLWIIDFVPESGILVTGNDPASLFEALTDLGTVTAHVRGELPEWAAFNPHDCYLSWQLTLAPNDAVVVDDESIREFFAWVEDECQLDIRQQSVVAEAESGWRIDFQPGRELLKSGNDPQLIFAELAESGHLHAQVDDSALPPFAAFCPTDLYLNWTLTLSTDVDRSVVDAAFEWVVDDCDLTVVALETPTSTVEPPTVTAEAVADVPPPSTSSESSPSAKSTVAPKANETAARSRKGSGDTSIRVDTDKVDALIDRVGELVITQAMLKQVSQAFGEMDLPILGELKKGLVQLERNTRDLQEDVMRIRMLPISFVFNRFPRVIHDVSAKLGKQVELVLIGEQTELDKTVMEKIGDPLIHLLRNSLDHGLETPQERIAAGKTESGTITLNAFHEGGYIVIQVSDDGRGLNRARILEKARSRDLIPAGQTLSDQEVDELIFLPGFSTADAVSDLSGRGVGMDVVRRNIESLGGDVGLKSEPGQGTTFTVRLPLTLAILDGQIVGVCGDTYIIPLVAIVETLSVNERMLMRLGGSQSLLHFRGQYIPLIPVGRVFGLGPVVEPRLIVVVEHAGQLAGLVIDELMGQQQAVIKSLEVNFKQIPGVAGASIMGDGAVALIIDVAGLMNRGLDGDLTSMAKRATQQEDQSV